MPSSGSAKDGSTAPDPATRVVAPPTAQLSDLPPSWIDRADPTHLGRYRVVDRIGQGGMGTVYRAHDPQLDRVVAIKLLRGQQDTQDVVRILREARAMAQLNHPNVVPIFDVETQGETVFIAMEYVSGETLRRWLRQPRDIGEIVEAFSQAGRGLAAAHAIGIIHRDFKPANVLIGRDGRTRVMDFGLARTVRAGGDSSSAASAGDSLDWTEDLTGDGWVMGTPRYMSPEQHEGHPLDERSDQYSFCFALYLAVTGTPPFSASDGESLLQLKKRGSIRPHPQLSRRLDQIVRRGLQARPEDRWPSMDSLLRQLETRPRRLLPSVLGAGVCALALAGWALLGGGSESSTHTCDEPSQGLADTWDEDRRAQMQAAFARTQAPFSASTWQHVESELETRAAAWNAAYEEVCALRAPSAEQGTDVFDLRMRCLDQQRTQLRALTDSFSSDEVTRDLVERAPEAIASLRDVERCADIEALRKKALPPGDPELLHRALELQERLAQAEALSLAGKYDEALVMGRQLEIDVTQLDHPALRSEVLLQYGHHLSLAGKYADSEERHRDAHFSALAAKDDWIATDAAVALIYTVGYMLARHGEGLQWAARAQAWLERAGDDRLRGSFFANRGSIFELQGRLEDARADFEQALSFRERFYGPDHPSTAAAADLVGGALHRMGRFDEAAAYMERSLRSRQKSFGAMHPTMSYSYNNLGALAFSRGHFDEALEHYQQALDVVEQSIGVDSPHVGAMANNMAYIHELQGELPQAEAEYQRACDSFTRGFGELHPHVAAATNSLGRVVSALGRAEEAELLHRRAINLWRVGMGPDHHFVGLGLKSLGSHFRRHGQLAEARRQYEAALEVLLATANSDPAVVAGAHEGLADVLLDTGDHHDAQRHYEASLATNLEAQGPDHPDTARVQTKLDRINERGAPATTL